MTSSSSPKFKVGDMVMLITVKAISSAPGGCILYGEQCGAAGLTSTVKEVSTARFVSQLAKCYEYKLADPCRKCGNSIWPIEPCLRLIKDGDLKLDENPNELNLEKLEDLIVAMWEMK